MIGRAGKFMSSEGVFHTERRRISSHHIQVGIAQKVLKIEDTIVEQQKIKRNGVPKTVTIMMVERSQTDAVQFFRSSR